MATDGTHLEWPSSVWSGAPVAASQSRTVLSCDPDTTCLLSGEKATDETQSEWPSSVWSGAPVAASQSRTVLSCDPDTTCLLSGEKATDETQSEWPSSVCRAAFQCASIFGVLWIQGGIHFLKCIRIILLFGAKTRAEQYNCSGVFSINDW